MNNRERLMSIISDNGLERRDIAELLMVKADEVDHWLLPHDAKNHEEMPDMAIELLDLKIAMRKSEQTETAAPKTES